MRSDLLPVLEYMEHEKGIARADMIALIAEAVSSAAKKSADCRQTVRVEIDPKTGELKAWAQFKVVDSVTDPDDEIHITKARQQNPEIALGDIFEQPIDPSVLGRIAAKTAQQLIMQQVRFHEKQHIYEQFRNRIGSILSGVVRFQERGNITIDFGKAEGTLFRNEAIWSEHFNPGDRITCLLQGIKETPRGPELMLTRAHPDFIKAMMINHDIVNDPYIQSVIYQQIKNRIDEAKTGVVKVHGNYSIVSGDPYLLCQSIFGLEKTGLLKAGEIYNQYWADAGAKELACFRAPMSCYENIRKVVPVDNEDVRYWFKYMKTCTILNGWDTTMAALNG